MQPLTFQDPTLPIETRVNDLVSRMTLEEKVSQMVHPASGLERLGVPPYNWWNECLHGVARAGVATVFPQAIGLAAMWNTELMRLVATAISDEARAKHHDFVRRGIREIYTGLTFWSPNINILRDPRWGRGQETYGEDPYLTSRLGIEFVKGLQGEDPRYLKLVATAKHYAVHSGPEPERHTFNARPPVRDLHETYLPAFEALVREGGTCSVMGAYNRTNDEPCCASETLLEKILRREWGFAGYVVSDCWAIEDIHLHHRVVATAEEAAALAVKNGCDLSCSCAYLALTGAVRQGLIDEATLDISVKRLFTARFKLGMFDPADQVPYAQIPIEVNDSPKHRALSLRAARESIVLLKNQDHLLPLKKDVQSIAVLGPNADDLSVLLGNYNGTPSEVVTPLEGIRRKVSPSTVVYHAQGCDIAPGVPTLHVIPPECLRPGGVAQGQRGLTGEYFANDHFEGKPALVRVDAGVDLTWWDNSPLGGQPTDKFSIRWTGVLTPPVSGAYTLAVTASSNYRLHLNGQEIFSFEENEHHAVTRAHRTELEAGRLYPIQVDYVNHGRDPQAHLLWAVPYPNYEAQALEVASKAQVVVMVLGLSPTLEGEEMPLKVEGFAGGDRTDIKLPGTQERLLKKIVVLGKPVVLVLLNGSAVAIHWANDNVPAIVEAWYPGEEGGTAIADVLFGDYNPAGRLPVTFYDSVDQLPPFDDYGMAGRTYRYMTCKPLYAFGHGLSYTRFKYNHLKIDPLQIDASGRVRVSLEVKNVGRRAGDEVVQLYVRYRGSKVTRPVQDLRGFARVSLEPGGSQVVEFELAASQLAYWGEGGWVIEPGTVEVQVGAASDDIRLAGEFVVR